jgi:hypothetical protein
LELPVAGSTIAAGIVAVAGAVAGAVVGALGATPVVAGLDDVSGEVVATGAVVVCVCDVVVAAAVTFSCTVADAITALRISVATPTAR